MHGITKGWSILNKPKSLPPVGGDSPGPKYDILRSEADRLHGGRWSAAPRFSSFEVVPGTPNPRTPGPMDYDVVRGERMTQRRLRCVVLPRPAKKGQRPSRTSSSVATGFRGIAALAPKKQKGSAWREQLQRDEAAQRHDDILESNPTLFLTTKRKKVWGGKFDMTQRRQCFFGSRTTPAVPRTPGPGEYNAIPQKLLQLTKEYKYLCGTPPRTALFGQGSDSDKCPPNAADHSRKQLT